MTPPGRLATAGIFLVAIAVAGLCAGAPLFAYAGSLAAFGLAHVATELRYVDQRFSARVGRGGLRAILGLLGAIVMLRLLAFTAAASSLPLRELELAAVAGLAATAAVLCVRRGDVFAAAISVATTAALAGGLAFAPATTIVVLALLHNLTPVGFLAERLRGSARRRALGLCAIVFVAVPILLIGGFVRSWLERAGLWNPDLAPFDVGPIEAHLGAFVPAIWIDRPFAVDLFAAAAWLQCAHYAVVIGVLPRLGAQDRAAPPATLVPWPRGPWFVVLACVASAVALAAFATAFGDARRAYGVVASIHAWSEVPVLLLSAGAGFGAVRAARLAKPGLFTKASRRTQTAPRSSLNRAIPRDIAGDGVSGRGIAPEREERGAKWVST